MKHDLCIGSYTEEILFGTGELFKGKGKGISIGTFEEGKIEIKHDIMTINPSYLCIDEVKRKIYAVNETKEYLGRVGGGVTQLSYNTDGELEQEITFNTIGTDSCHIVKSPNEKFLVVSNFASGDLSVFYLDESGNMTGEMEVFHHKGSSAHPIRQKSAHAHSAIFAPDGKYMYIPDLGIDCVKAYSYEDGKVKAVPEVDVNVPAGSGPRFGEFNNSGSDFYLINELTSQVMHFKYANGKMIPQEIVSTLPESFTGDNICSDLHLTPDNKFLYASNRGHDSIVCYAVDEDGKLAFVQCVGSGGKTPRNFCIDPDGRYVLVGNQDSDNITVFEIKADGTLEKYNQKECGSPVCIKFFKL